MAYIVKSKLLSEDKFSCREAGERIKSLRERGFGYLGSYAEEALKKINTPQGVIDFVKGYDSLEYSGDFARFLPQWWKIDCDCTEIPEYWDWCNGSEVFWEASERLIEILFRRSPGETGLLVPNIDWSLPIYDQLRFVIWRYETPFWDDYPRWIEGEEISLKEAKSLLKSGLPEEVSIRGKGRH
jgi:hypothetical protein